MPTPASLPNLTVQQLDYLVAVARDPTWAAAAASVGVTPSALSQGLAELERRVGVPLFGRDGRRRVLTANAAVVLAHAEAVVARTQDLAGWATQIREGKAGRIRIGMIDAAAVDHYPTVLRSFRQSRPDLDIHLAVAPSGGLLADLAAAALDLVVCVEPPEPVEGVVASVLRAEPLAVYAPEGGGPIGKPATWGPWVTFPTGSHTRSMIAMALAAAGARFDVVAESHQPEVLREMVVLGMGWTVLPVVQAERQPVPLRRARREPLLERRLVIAQRIDAIGDPAVDALIDALHRASSKRTPAGRAKVSVR